MFNKINSDGTFSREEKISYSDVDYSLRARVTRLVEMCQDIAVSHSDEAGYTLDYFRSSHSGWALTGWHFIFSRRPRERDSLKLTTWTKPYRRIQATRNFKACDSDGNEYFHALSRWFLLDTSRRKPMRFDRDFFSSYVPSELPDPVEEPGFAHDDPSLYTPAAESLIQVTRRDIDANGHTNNVAYITWAMDHIPAGTYLESDIKELRAEYKKEALLGDTVKVSTMKRQLPEGTEYLTLITPAEDSCTDGSGLLCSVTTLWS